jgi:molybdopterin molybdotransferase
VGATQLCVSRFPRIAVQTSGDELRPASTATDQLEAGCLRNSNGPMVIALLQSLLRSPDVEIEHLHVPDEAERTLAGAREALGRSNLVVSTGGVSVGPHDLLPAAWRRLGLDCIIHGVQMQPGKPLLALQPEGEQEKMVLGLPGNPVSALVSAHLFVWPLLRKMGGQDPRLPWRRVWLCEPAQPNPQREAFRAAKLAGSTGDQATVLTWHGSGDLMHTAAAQGWVRLPPQSQPVPAGSPIPYLPTG